MQQVSVEEAEGKLSALIAELKTGEEVVITRDNIAVAKIVPLAPAKPRCKAGSAKGQVWMAEDFDAPSKISKSICDAPASRAGDSPRPCSCFRRRRLGPLQHYPSLVVCISRISQEIVIG